MDDLFNLIGILVLLAIALYILGFIALILIAALPFILVGLAVFAIVKYRAEIAGFFQRLKFAWIDWQAKRTAKRNWERDRALLEDAVDMLANYNEFGFLFIGADVWLDERWSLFFQLLEAKLKLDRTPLKVPSFVHQHLGENTRFREWESNRLIRRIEFEDLAVNHKEFVANVLKAIDDQGVPVAVVTCDDALRIAIKQTLSSVHTPVLPALIEVA